LLSWTQWGTGNKLVTEGKIISCTADTRTTSKPFPHASWGRLDMQPNKNIKKPKQGEKESKKGTRKLRFWHMGC
jgi:hypothetical protein